MEKDSTASELFEKRNQKIEELKSRQVQLFPNHFKVENTVGEIKKILAETPDVLTEQGPFFCVAGRMMAVNRFGKAAFIRFADRTGQLQAYIQRDKVGENAYADFKLFDIGDFVRLKGSIFQTKTGEWTLLTNDIQLLSKAKRPLPEKFHGLKDPEKRYRQRYIDLLMNPEVRELFIKRSRIVETVRQCLLERDFLEVETPMMQPIPGGAEAEPFVTHHNALGMDLYLRIAPELYLKRLIVGGFERVFEINRNFRNEGISTRHNPEFTMVEFYQAYATYEDLMDFTEDIFKRVAETVNGSTIVEYQGHAIDFGGKFQRMSLFSSLETIGGMDPGIMNDRDKLLEFASSKGIKITKTGRVGKMITKLFDTLVEPHLIQPTFVTGYPVEVSPLSRRNDQEPDMTERFELFVGGREIANGFSELNDPDDQKSRFLQQVEDRAAGDKEAHCMDEDYIEALEYGMPPTAGEGIGIDRLVMLLTNAASIREVILFPHMKAKTQN
ncbi:MAG: lysine--tRNA ligase [Proteobacteria bacterium]|nr:lysine--tRNA ligase [Pseudomonadota bacterium]MBU4470677.1 lysine--tRNA ligase [Pseudomonadota bacterium]MCG2751228.1 lysine--tRNA ligase [Desulfobacteraceae bacterium]